MKLFFLSFCVVGCRWNTGDIHLLEFTPRFFFLSVLSISIKRKVEKSFSDLDLYWGVERKEGVKKPLSDLFPLEQGETSGVICSNLREYSVTQRSDRTNSHTSY